MNIPATLSALKLLYNPSLFLPHQTISTFQHLPIPLSYAFRTQDGDKPDIRAVVLDKDDCFAEKGGLEVWKPFRETFENLRATYPPPHLLIVSNSSGTDDDPQGREAAILEANTGVPVLRHSQKVCPDLLLPTVQWIAPAEMYDQKPAAHAAIMSYFLDHPKSTVTSASQVAVVGDRLFTDVVMANTMGAWGVWVRDGLGPSREKSVFMRLEGHVFDYLRQRGYKPPIPGEPYQNQH